ncbi:prephenate dehydratase [Nocardioides sp. Bht2]|uniref:prephenate dehydratase n=1 Tax=Nocardioides sp. Bht2 TaxID=3392297 RepID=UPI0039B6B9B5
MTTKKIAYQGEPGANSDIACRDVYPDWESLPCASFEDAFTAVQNGVADLAMIPIDNSLAGRVADIHHYLPTSGLHIVGEYFLPIHFDLLALPGTTPEMLKTVRSHVHALGQCRNVISKYGLRPVIAGDTAGSAREVAEFGDPTVAALAPPLAGEVYGLVPLASNVEDAEHNTTRFVVLARESEIPPVNGDLTVTTFVFRVRNLPAALYKALGGFATNGVNMTKLESYMVDGEFTATVFLADVEGHPDEIGLARALEELEFYTTELTVLGVYPGHPFRLASRS